MIKFLYRYFYLKFVTIESIELIELIGDGLCLYSKYNHPVMKILLKFKIRKLINQ